MKTQFLPSLKSGFFAKSLGVLVVLLLSATNMNAANVTSLTTGNWSATAWPNTTRTATITTSTANATVTGTGTLFTTEISVGNIIKTTGNVAIGTVLSVTNNTTLVLTTNAATTNTGITYNSQGVGSVDAITLASGAVLTVDGSYSCASLIFGTTGTSTLTISSTNSLSITGLLSMPRPGTLNTFAVGAGTLTTGSLTLGGTSSGRNTVVTVSTGTVNVSGTFTGAGTANPGGSVFTFTGAGTLNVGGATTNAIPQTTTLWTFTPSTGTVNFNGAAQTLGLNTFNNLTLSGSGAKTFPLGATTVNGTLSIENGTNVNTFTGTLTYGASATLQYNSGASVRTVSTEWPATFAGTGGVIVEGTGTITTNGAKALTAPAPLNINAGATLATGATNTFTLTVGGTTTVDGTLTLANTGAKTFTGDATVGGVWNETGVAAINYAGNLTVNTGATFTASATGAHTFTGTARTIGGTLGTISIPSISISVSVTNNLTTAPGLNISTTFAGAGGTLTQGSNAILTYGGTTVVPALTATVAGNTFIYNALAVQTVKPTSYSNLTLSGSSLKTTTGVTVNGILSMEGTATTSALPTYGTSAILQYKGSSQQATGLEFPASSPLFSGVKIENANGTGVTLNAVKNIGAKSFTIGSSATGSIFNDGGFQITGTGTLTLSSGTFKLGAAAAATTFPAFATSDIAAGTTVEYAATATQTIKGISYSNLTISGTGANSKTADADITVDGILNLSSSNASTTQGCLSMSTFTLNMGTAATTTGTGDVTGDRETN
ncbi:MAG: hypothetical protein WCL03_09230 [Bacteroidota bacterium]